MDWQKPGFLKDFHSSLRPLLQLLSSKMLWKDKTIMSIGIVFYKEAKNATKKIMILKVLDHTFCTS